MKTRMNLGIRQVRSKSPCAHNIAMDLSFHCPASVPKISPESSLYAKMRPNISCLYGAAFANIPRMSDTKMQSDIV